MINWRVHMLGRLQRQLFGALIEHVEAARAESLATMAKDRNIPDRDRAFLREGVDEIFNEALRDLAALRDRPVKGDARG